MSSCPVEGNPVDEYLIHSYLYYNLDESIIPDHKYDALCAWMLENFDSLDGEYVDLVEKDALKAGTGHHLMFKFPETIKAQAKKRLEEYNGK